RSVAYSVESLTRWLERYGTDDTVLVFLGDHQPIARVSGSDASRDVPVSVVAKDPEVPEKISGWNWTEGLTPAKAAPVWRTDVIRPRPGRDPAATRSRSCRDPAVTSDDTPCQTRADAPVRCTEPPVPRAFLLLACRATQRN